MRVARVAAQAKLNLVLRVFGKRSDGYHNIFTVLQRIDLADDITVRARDDARRSIACRGPQMPPGGLGPDEKNLAFRAAAAFQSEAGWPQGFDIEIDKQIPVGGGLGGGSADAGAVLRALNALAPNAVDPDRLVEIGATVGSDVAFLAGEHVCAIAGGRGERIVGLRVPPPPREVLLIVPAFGVSTADAYRWIDESRGDMPTSAPDGADALEAWAAQMENDFEPAVEEHHPILRRYRESLTKAGAESARLSGSGSTVFGLFRGRAPSASQLGIDAPVIATRTSARVVEVEVLQ